MGPVVACLAEVHGVGLSTEKDAVMSLEVV